MIAITTTRIGFNQDLVFLIPLLLYTPKSFVNITVYSIYNIDRYIILQ